MGDELFDKGYIDPLLSALAIDYSITAREGLVANKIMPVSLVSKPAGHIYTFSKEQAYKMTDDTFSEDGDAKELKSHGTKLPYSSTARGNRTFINKGEEAFKEGPFVRAEKDYVNSIILNIERNHEIRVRDKILNLTGRSLTLTGTGSAKTNKWLNKGGDPFTVIQDGIKACFFRPNVMIMSETVLDALEYHPILLEKLGEANMIKKINEETLAKLFRVNEVVISAGRGDNSKFNKSGTVDPQLFWGNNVVFGYKHPNPKAACSGRTLIVDIPGSESGYVVRKWNDDKKGLLGGTGITAGCYMDEYVVSEELIFSLQDVL